MRVGPDRATFVELYMQADGDIREFNKLLLSRGEEPMAERTFRRRVVGWITGMDYERNVSLPKDDGDDHVIAGGVVEAPDHRRVRLSGKRFVFTSAQNNTHLHNEFWQNLLRFCEVRDAQLVVGKFRYNKSGFQNATAEKDGNDLWFDPRIQPYALTSSAVLVDSRYGTIWCGELDILPTAANPLSGLDSYTHTASSIVPHAKVQMVSVPVMKGTPKKMLYTTGAVTKRNYIQRKAGQKAEFHHVFGALYVEIDEEGNEFRRQLIADSSGSFYDLTDLFVAGRHEPNQTVHAINWGDIHAEMSDKVMTQGAWGSADSMLRVLKPKYQFIHDLTDFRARNHHNIKNPHFLAESLWGGYSSVEDGMICAHDTLRYLSTTLDFDTTVVVVESNHDLAFRRWLAEADIRHDPLNAYYYHTANAALHAAIRDGNTDINIFEWAMRRIHPLPGVLFLTEDDSFVIVEAENGIECGMHGHRGPNGSRGSMQALRRLGRKCNIGHVHSAGIVDGIYAAGISCKEDLGYNKGPSSWSQSHIVTYHNGKRAIVTMTNGKWRA